MEKIIIGIHGLANKPDPDILNAWWETSIKEGLRVNLQLDRPEFDFDMVYWADLLYKHPLHVDATFDFDLLYNDEPYIEAGEGTIVEYDENLLDEIRGKIFDIFGSALDVIRDRYDPDFLGNWIIKKVPRDLAFYYDDRRKINNRLGVKEVANKVLRDELTNLLEKHKDKEIMLIAHSMGTIIAYDVLRDLGQRPNNDIHVKHFITMGSPLGLPFVKHKIKEQRGYDAMNNKVRTPSIVTGDWTNYADKKDPIALDFYLKDDFGANAAGVKVKDDLVSNDYIGISGKQNHHKSYGYLRTPELSKKIADFLM